MMVRTVKVPAVRVADAAVMSFPRGTSKNSSVEDDVIYPFITIFAVVTESPALITPSVSAESGIVRLPILPLFAYRNCPFVSEVGVPVPIVGTFAISLPSLAHR